MIFTEAKNENNEELQQYIPVAAAFDFNKIKTYILQCEEEYLLPLLDEEMYQILNAYYQDNTGLDETELKFIRLCQQAVINLAMWKGFDVISAQITASGFHQQESAEQKALYKYKEDGMRNTFKITGFNSLDFILMHLEKNIATFPEYVNSQTYSINKAAVFPDTASFDKCYYIGKSRLTFLRLQQHITTVEQLILSDEMQGQLELMKQSLASVSPDAKYVGLRAIVQPCLANLAVSHLLQESPGMLTDKGYYFEAYEATMTSGNTAAPVASEQQSTIAAIAHADGMKYLQKIKKYLKDNFALDISTSNAINRDNTDKLTFFA
ncbi:MAG: hypothetical protein JXB49_37155 [Bacteroidales bacterium]|nr:hypothetical protein [Bacteroidales bacterium]